MKNNRKIKYGLLCYSTVNIGDEIQSLAARNFLPKVDFYLDRDNLKEVKSNKRIKMIMNGWFMENPKNWPPSKAIDPLFISFHISEKNAKKMISKRSLEYLKKHEPIGCRDYYTRDLLNKNGVKSYFSGCLTLTLKKKNLKKSNELLLVDLNMAGIKLKDLPEEIVKKSKIINHLTYRDSFINKKIVNTRVRIQNNLPSLYNLMDLTKLNKSINRLVGQKNNINKYDMAEKYLKRYEKAKLVITSRIHSALPCLALDTPVIFVHKNFNDPRFGGLKEYLRCYTPEEFKREIKKINLKNPPKNPKSIKKIRLALIKRVREFINN